MRTSDTASDGKEEGKEMGDASENDDDDENDEQELLVEDEKSDEKCIKEDMERETRLHRVLLCLYGFRSMTRGLRTESFAAQFIGNGSPRLQQLLQVSVHDTDTSGLGDISHLEESWLILNSLWYEMRREKLRGIVGPDLSKEVEAYVDDSDAADGEKKDDDKDKKK